MGIVHSMTREHGWGRRSWVRQGSSTPKSQIWLREGRPGGVIRKKVREKLDRTACMVGSELVCSACIHCTRGLSMDSASCLTRSHGSQAYRFPREAFLAYIG